MATYSVIRDATQDLTYDTLTDTYVTAADTYFRNEKEDLVYDSITGTYIAVEDTPVTPDDDIPSAGVTSCLPYRDYVFYNLRNQRPYFLIYNNKLYSLELSRNHNKNKYTYTINTIPANADVTLSVNDNVITDKTITVAEGTIIEYYVSAVGYAPIRGVTVVTGDTLDTVELRSDFTLTINTIPNDANVVLTAAGYNQKGKSITVNYGTEVKYTVSKNLYISKSGSQVVTSDNTVSVSLAETQYPITLACDGKEWDENDTYEILGTKITLTYQWRFPIFNIYVDGVLIHKNVKPNNTFIVNKCVPGSTYTITQKREYLSGGEYIEGIIEDFQTGVLEEGGLTLKMDITTAPHAEGGAASVNVANYARYDVYITTPK
jgi:hypothetical protein